VGEMNRNCRDLRSWRVSSNISAEMEFLATVVLRASVDDTGKISRV
jgi:hypothetical protein